MADVPQPSPQRLTPFPGSPVVVGIVPDQPSLVTLTAASLSHAMGDTPLVFGYVDPNRYPLDEHADGSVTHSALDPDVADDSWRQTEELLRQQITTALAGAQVPWVFHYLAGSPPRALTHLARAVDAAAVVVGTRAPGAESRMKEFFEGSVATHLSHHQHRPVLVVPLAVTDWKVSGRWG